MAKKLWQTTQVTNKLIEQYTAGDDVRRDQKLVAFDIYGSLAHANMLAKQQLIDPVDLANIQTGLGEILQLYRQGKYQLDVVDEDVHTKIEQDLTHKYPDSGAKLHTGRSRNDQVLVDLRLYTKSELIEVVLVVFELVTLLVKQAKRLAHLPLVGMTHMQPAMLASFGLWLGSFAESLLDDLWLMESVFKLNDQSPLGSGAAYGVTVPIDREYTTRLLGFAKVQHNALYCQNSKGKIEAAVGHALLQIMATLNKFATDSLLFTTEPFSFVSFESSLSTGSSIMPQKQNWDALELMRAKYHRLQAIQLQITSSLANLPSGYNRDLQSVKGAVIDAFEITLSSVQVAKLFVQSIEVNEEEVDNHLPTEIYAAHWAFVLGKEKQLPFRQAYQYVKMHLNEIPQFSPQAVFCQTESLGLSGQLDLEKVEKVARESRQDWTQRRQKFDQVIQKLVQQVGK